VVLVLSLLLAAAVSTKPVVTPRLVPSKVLGACSAVTADDLERALGRRFGRGQEQSHGAERPITAFDASERLATRYLAERGI
jgi:hypothetical protein